MTAAHLWFELRRRRVFKTALWYAGSSVAVVETAGLFSSIFGLSTGIVRFLAIAAVFGLPTAFMLSWCFDVATHSGRAVMSWQKMAGLSLIAGVSLLGAIVVWDRLMHDADGATRARPLEVDPAHIAVLSFDALGGDPQLVAFAEKLHARLIDGLSRASTNRGSQRLRVVSRPGIMPYADGDASLYELRRRFKVGTVLNGTVEQVADAVRVHVRMVDTETGDQIATSLVEERADDELTLLDAAADSVVHMIRAELGPIVREHMQLLETRSPRAFERYRLATERVNQFLPALHQQDVDGALMIVTEADSLFALAARSDRRWIEPIVARGRLARLHHMIHGVRPTHDMNAVLNASFEHAERAFKVAPNDYRAFELRGELRAIAYDLEGDSAEAARLAAAAERDLRTALADNPTPAYALRKLAELEASQGRYHQALDYSEDAYAEDTYLEQVSATLLRLFEYSFALEEDEKAARWCKEGREQFADHVFDDCRLALGAWSDDYPLTPDSGWILVNSALANYPAPFRPKLEVRFQLLMAAVLTRNNQPDSARALLRSARARDQGVGASISSAGVYTLLGDRDAAIATLRHLLATSPEERITLQWEPALRRIRDDARFEQLIRR